MNTNTLLFRVFTVDFVMGDIIKLNSSGPNLMIINGEVSWNKPDVITLVQLNNGKITKMPLEDLLDMPRVPFLDNRTYRSYVETFFAMGHTRAHLPIDDDLEFGERCYDVRHLNYAGRLNSIHVSAYSDGEILTTIKLNGAHTRGQLIYTVPFEHLSFGIASSEETDEYSNDDSFLRRFPDITKNYK